MDILATLADTIGKKMCNILFSWGEMLLLAMIVYSFTGWRYCNSSKTFMNLLKIGSVVCWNNYPHLPEVISNTTHNSKVEPLTLRWQYSWNSTWGALFCCLLKINLICVSSQWVEQLLLHWLIFSYFIWRKPFTLE